MGKPEGKILLGKPKLRLVDNVRMDLGETGWEGINWIVLAQGKGFCERYNELSGSIKCWEVFEYQHNLRSLEKGSAPWR
jgi:hypothetical protein